ncbi:MAG: hypothetical protein ACD_44C00195G0004 [uncultured bacterium]|nr:MAG: hypothetical protein ACD_44C00195G0004 [uncultured bacterium]OGT15075.1 MAG: hypothetical protein A3B69_04495 [Gammaproteobacteria bacterium RIFCSPHIGHO2_02_FULL_38_33]OGT66799.1 MAG: hypothetical protein A3I12_01895 [Gammaproteobacteria bacterium RIFCSPLOWO2_02_FULL_38_11]
MYFKRKELNTLILPELLQELNPDQIPLKLRYTSDIQYQKEVALALEQHRLTLSQQMNPEEHTHFLLKMATAFLESGLYGKAEAYFHETLNNLEHVQNSNSRELIRARCFFGYAVVFRELRKEQEKANEYFQKSWDTTGILNQRDFWVAKLQADICRNWGIFHLTTQHYLEAMDRFEQGIKIARQFPELRLFLIPLINYAGLAAGRAVPTRLTKNECDDFTDKAKKYFDEASNAYRDEISRDPTLKTDCQDYASHLYHRGLVCKITEDYEHAIQYLGDALRIRRECHYEGQQRGRIADILFDLGDAYLNSDNFHYARPALEEAKTIYAELDNKPKQAAVEDLLERCPQEEAATSLRCASTH